MFGRLRDLRGIATLYDLCPEIFFSAVLIGATYPLLIMIKTLNRPGFTGEFVVQ